MTRRGYFDFEAECPKLFEGSKTFYVSTNKVEHLQRFGPKQKFFDTHILRENMSGPIVFRDLKREGFEDCFAIVSKPKRRLRDIDIEIPFPPNRVLVIYVSARDCILDWESRPEDTSNPGFPENWTDDFGEVVQ